MHLSRRLGAVGAAAVLALASMAVFVAPVAATDVDTDAEFRAAWADSEETLITLTADITLTCTDQPERASDTDIVIEGGSFMLLQPCEDDDALHASGGGNVTVRNLNIVGTSLSDDGIDTEAHIILESARVASFAENGLETDGPVTISGGSAVEGNGDFGIDAGGEVTVSSSVVSDNVDVGVWSGDEADVWIIGSTISGNGGDGVNAGAEAIAIQSTIVGNGFGPQVVDESEGARTTSDIGVLGKIGGGGLDGSSVLLDNSTVVDNASFGAFADVDINSFFTTISGNEINLATPQSPQTIHLFASVVIEPTAFNCLGPVVDEGFNFVDDDSCSPVAANAADPMLGALAFNGGQTETRLPAAGSPLVDGVPQPSCEKTSEDQRGIHRPQQAACDIGSVEVLGATTPTSPSATPAASELPDTASSRSSMTTGGLAVLLSVVFVASLGGLSVARVRTRR